jgi:hypothetical protein
VILLRASGSRKLGILVLLAATLGATASPAADLVPAVPPSWKLFESPALRFRIRLPPEPVRTEEVRSTFVGKVNEFQLLAKLPGAEFVVQVRELPRATRWFVTEKYILSQVMDGFLESGERPEISDEPIMRSGHPGRHIRYEVPKRGDGDWVEDALIFLVENHLYFVVVARKRASEAELPIEAFLRSFELW